VLGAALFTLGWLAATAALGYYATNFANYGATYGSLGGVIVLMLWLYVTGALLLIGAELTAALAQVRTPGEIRRRREEEDVGSAIGGASAEARRRAASAAGSAVETARESPADPGRPRKERA
jgi:membrane protein